MYRSAQHAVALCLLATTAASAQEPAPPVFSAGAEVVLLDLVVRDKKGRMVEDLRPEEIHVFEDGERCAIESFRLVRTELEALPSATPAGEPASATAASAAPAPAEEERQLTSVVVLVFDLLTHDPALRARRAAMEMLERPLGRFPNRRSRPPRSPWRPCA